MFCGSTSCEACVASPSNGEPVVKDKFACLPRLHICEEITFGHGAEGVSNRFVRTSDWTELTVMVPVAP